MGSFWIQIFYWVCSLQILSPELWLAFSLPYECLTFDEQKFFYFNNAQFIDLLWLIIFASCSVNLSLIQIYENILCFFFT